MIHATEDEARKALSALFTVHNWSGTDAQRKLKLDAYWKVLSDLPFELITRVCARACRGLVGEPGFMPTAAQLHVAAVKMLPPPVDYFRSDVKLLEARIPINEREAVKQGLEDLARELASNKRVDRVGKAE